MEREAVYTPTTLFVPLPSSGRVYPAEYPLANKDQIAIREMTAAEEDILTSLSLIRTGKAIDTVLQNCILEKNIDVSKMLVGDRNSIIVGLILASYGNEYKTDVKCANCNETNKEYTFDINNLPVKSLGVDPVAANSNEFKFTLPKSKLDITFSLATVEDEKEISTIVDRSKKAYSDAREFNVTTRLKRLIKSINNEYSKEKIAEFIDRRQMPIKDSSALRNYIDQISPDVDMDQDFNCIHCGYSGKISMPIDFAFFWRAK
jgi:hypothetical protein